MNEPLLLRLRKLLADDRAGGSGKPVDAAVWNEWNLSGVRFAAETGKLEGVYYNALRKLIDCIVPAGGEHGPILFEGGAYSGCWLESTGTISAELLSRFMPYTAESTFHTFAAHQREDGMLPYKVTAHGPSYRQIQLVTPLARSVWNHYSMHGRDENFLRVMYNAMSTYDGWLAKYRNTRGTGCVEAFCAYDTGHDLSPRFWHVADTPHQNDPTQYSPDSPILPFLAPDLTANMYCQRTYLARIAAELGEEAEPWAEKASASLASLFRYCFDKEDCFFYDRDCNDEFVRVQSDVLLRVMACEVGDLELFDTMLRKYLLNTRKFFAKYPYTSIAMDDPRFDPFSSYNSWAGPTNFLSLIRTPHAFERHHRYVELTWIIQPIISTMTRMTRFAQTLSPWTGAEGYTESYSPAILCVLDFVERLCGIMPRPDDTLWFTGLLPYDQEHGEPITGDTAYSRTVDGVVFELVNTRESCAVIRNDGLHMRFPAGIRVVADRAGDLRGLIGMSVRTIEGTLYYKGREIPLAVKGNEQLAYENGVLASVSSIGIVPPTYR